MRISGGKLKGRTIKVPPGVIRPAMDRMRESLFSVLGPIEGRSFLDLFSGSGIVGIEAHSRGASPVVLVERDRGKRRTVLDNLSGLESEIALRIEPVERFVSRNKTRFDIVYLDPPFKYPHKTDLLERLAISNCVADGGVVMIHAPGEEPFAETIGSLRRSDRREYGRSVVTFFSFAESHPPV